MLLLLSLLAAEGGPAPWNGSVNVTTVWGLIIIVGLVIGGIIFLWATGRNSVTLVEKARADGNAGLVKTREDERDNEKKRADTAEAKIVELEGELEDVTAELRTVVGIKLEDLKAYWIEYIESEAKKQQMKNRIRILEKAAIEGD